MLFLKNERKLCDKRMNFKENLPKIIREYEPSGKKKQRRPKKNERKD